MSTTAPTASLANAPSPVLRLAQIKTGVYRVHLSDGQHVGNLNQVGAVWKFKAIGYDATGAIEPGGGPLTDQHNAVFEQADAAAVGARLGPCLTARRTTDRTRR
jgi:hypothetical protein